MRSVVAVSVLLALPSSALACAFHGNGPHTRLYGGMGSTRPSFGIMGTSRVTYDSGPVLAGPNYTVDDARSQFLARYKIKPENDPAPAAARQ